MTAGTGKRLAALSLTAALTLTACGSRGSLEPELMITEPEEKRTVTLFSPMEKTDPDAENTARSAADKTIAGRSPMTT